MARRKDWLVHPLDTVHPAVAVEADIEIGSDAAVAVTDIGAVEADIGAVEADIGAVEADTAAVEADTAAVEADAEGSFLMVDPERSAAQLPPLPELPLAFCIYCMGSFGRQRHPLVHMFFHSLHTETQSSVIPSICSS
jgi:hypothetical protein